jgi:hypothetical protein
MVYRLHRIMVGDDTDSRQVISWNTEGVEVAVLAEAHLRLST